LRRCRRVAELPGGGWAAALSGSALPEKLVGTARARSTPAEAAPPRSSPASAGSSRSVGSGSTPVTRRPRGARALAPVDAHELEPGRRFANALDFQLQLDGWCDHVNQRVHRTIRAVPPTGCLRSARGCSRCRPCCRRRSPIRRRVAQQPYLRIVAQPVAKDARYFEAKQGRDLRLGSHTGDGAPGRRK
jgi:hypothetical protein